MAESSPSSSDRNPKREESAMPQESRPPLTQDEERVFQVLDETGVADALRALGAIQDATSRRMVQEFRGYNRRWTHPLGLTIKL